MSDLWLAIGHHLAFFALFGVFVAEFATIRVGMNTAALKRAGALDLAYGALAGLVLVVGVLRLMYGAKGWAFYEGNPWFWAKMACFAAVGLLSIYPTLRLLAWRKALRADGSAIPADADIRGVRRFLHLQALFFILIPVLAAAMARWGAF